MVTLELALPGPFQGFHSAAAPAIVCVHGRVQTFERDVGKPRQAPQHPWPDPDMIMTSSQGEANFGSALLLTSQGQALRGGAPALFPCYSFIA